jgi:hypothetical protein
MRRGWLGLLLLLAACGGRPASEIPLEEDTPDHRACRAEARNSPGITALNAQRNSMNQFNAERLANEQRVLFGRAYRDCLRARGLAAPGGVEPLRPR